MTMSVGADGGKGTFMFDLDHIASQLPEWDFPMTIGGTSYPTRALTQGDLQFLADVQAGRVAETGRVLAFIDSLFPAAKPDLLTMPTEVIGILVTAMDRHARQRVQDYLQQRSGGSGGRVRQFLGE